MDQDAPSRRDVPPAGSLVSGQIQKKKGTFLSGANGEHAGGQPAVVERGNTSQPTSALIIESCSR